MKNMMTFSNADFGEVRTVSVNGDPWFVGRDICKAFGDKNPNRSLSRVEDEDKMVMPLTDSLGRTQKAVCTLFCSPCSRKKQTIRVNRMRTPSQCRSVLKKFADLNVG